MRLNKGAKMRIAAGLVFIAFAIATQKGIADNYCSPIRLDSFLGTELTNKCSPICEGNGEEPTGSYSVTTADVCPSTHQCVCKKGLYSENPPKINPQKPNTATTSNAPSAGSSPAAQ